MHVCRRCGISADQLALRIHLRVIFVTVVDFVVLLCPAGIAVLLSSLRRIDIEAFWTLALFDLRVLFTSVALPRSRDEASVVIANCLDK